MSKKARPLLQQKQQQQQQQQQQLQLHLLVQQQQQSNDKRKQSRANKKKHKSSGQQQQTTDTTIKMIPERTLIKISATFTIALVAILVFNNLEPSEPSVHSITRTIHLCRLENQPPSPIQHKVLAYDNKTLVNFVGHLKFVRRIDAQSANQQPRRRRQRHHHDPLGASSSSYRQLFNAVQTNNHNEEEDEDGEEEYHDDYNEEQRGFIVKYLPLQMFFVHIATIDDDYQELYLICMCASFKLHLARVHDNIWTTRDVPQDVSTYIHSRKQEYKQFYLDGLEFDQANKRFHCDQPWQVPIDNLPARHVDHIVEPYDEISLHIEQLDLEVNGGDMIKEKIFTKPIQECQIPSESIRLLP